MVMGKPGFKSKYSNLFLKKYCTYLFDRERQRERGTQAGGAGEGEAGSTWGSIPGLWDHDLS